jgi:hypothetical protein
MTDTTVDATLPTLVRVVPISMGSATRPAADSDSEFEEEHDGNIFVGLKYAMVIYAFLGLTIVAGWRLYHLF